jgi:hypothetical protein
LLAAAYTHLAIYQRHKPAPSSPPHRVGSP